MYSSSYGSEPPRRDVSSSYGSDIPPRRDVSGFRNILVFSFLLESWVESNFLLLELQGGGSSYSSVYSSRGLGGTSYSGGGGGPGSYYWKWVSGNLLVPSS